MSQVVTELVIDADTSGADRFTQAMSGAEQSVSGMNAGLLAMGAGTVGALAGLKQVMDYVASANKDLADMQTVARQVGLTLADFQGIKLGGEISGLTDGQINQGLERSASLLNDAQRNANSLSKELDANGISIKNANGQLISENQLLGIAADLVKKAASPGDQLAVAQMLGFTKEWIPLLQQGSGAMSGLTDEAKKAGAVIDDETVQRASEFDEQWRKSSAMFSANMKASLVSLLPYVDDLIDGANKFIKSIDVAKLAQAADDHVKDVLKPGDDALKEAGIGGIKIEITPETSQAMHDFINSPFFSDEFWSNAGRIFSSSVQIINPADSKWYDGSAPVTDYSGAAQTFQWQSAGDSWKKMQSGYLDGAGNAGGPHSKVAGRGGGDDSEDAYDRAINQIEKHTARTIADTEAVGKGAGAQEELRAQAQLLTAAEQAGLTVTQAMRDKIQDLAQDAGDAALQLAKVKVANDNAFGRNTSFLSQNDVQIASQLKNIYPDVAEALSSAEAAQMRFNTAARGLSSSIENSLVSGLTDITSGAKSASQGFADMSNTIIKAIEQMIIKITIVEPLMRGLQSAFSGGINLSGAGFNPIAGATGSAHGNVFSGGNVVAFAQGGVVDSPHIAPMALFGEAGPEAIVPLRRGADGNLGIASSGGGGGGGSNVTIHNYTDAKPQVSRGSNGDVTIVLKKMVDDAVGDSLSTGSGKRVLSGQYGVKQFAGQ
jgi:hypothetical protein